MSVLEQVRFATTWVADRPAPWDSEQERRGDPPSSWDCTITYRGETMEVPFWMGPAHTDPPTAADVLECLTSDYTYADDPAELDDLLHDVPYSRAVEVVEALRRNAEDLRRVFGDDLDALAEEVRDQ